MRDFLKEIENRILVYDGSTGYLLQLKGLKGGECGELWNLTNREAVTDTYRSYIEAGSDVIQTNTFQGNRLHLQKYALDEKTYDINFWGARLAREAAGENHFVSASIGPLGILFEPSGELNFEMAYEIYREQVKAVADGGADVINFETFTDLAEMRAALLAAKETTDLPVICSLAFENNGRTLMGTEPFIAVTVLKALGADMIGANCSFGPEHMLGIAKGMFEAGKGYLSIKPNAGLPQMIGNEVRYEETAEHFASVSAGFIKYGARLIGGCCGSTPDYIKALKRKVSFLQPVAVRQGPSGIITSSVRYVDCKKLDWQQVGILDASKDKGLLDALYKNDFSFIEDTALDMASEGYDAVYVNVDAANGDDGLLSSVVDRIQWYVKAPLIIETAKPVSLNKALRIYRGVAGVAAANMSEQSQSFLKEVAAKFGCVIVTPGLNI